MFKKFPIIKEVKDMAKEWSDFIGNKHSIKSDGRNLEAGNYAEVIFWRMYPSARRISDIDRQADFVLSGKRIDVKAKDRMGPATGQYEASIEDRQRDYNCDFYAFFSYNRPALIMEFCGWISKKEYFKKAIKVLRGTVDRNNSWKCSVDCWNLHYRFLHR